MIRSSFTPWSTYFYPRPPCGGRPSAANNTAQTLIISIHVPLAGDDRGNRGRPSSQAHFYPRPPCGGRRCCAASRKTAVQFLSTSPLRGTTCHAFSLLPYPVNFYPRPPCGGRQCADIRSGVVYIFLSTSPLRGTTHRNTAPLPTVPFLSTSPLRGTTTSSRFGWCQARISIHVPLAGDDDIQNQSHSCTSAFLSTSPLRGTTHLQPPFPPLFFHFYPRPPCGGRRWTPSRRSLKSKISIHVPLAGDDLFHANSAAGVYISIHVPLAGDDSSPGTLILHLVNFYPRPPCGGRPGFSGSSTARRIFLSTSPLRGTTKNPLLPRLALRISIHVPLAGDDLIICCLPFARLPFLSTSPLRGTTRAPERVSEEERDFYPRPPCGGRLFLFFFLILLHYFYPRPPCGGRPPPHISFRAERISIHVPLAGDDSECLPGVWCLCYFYPRPPCGGRRQM